MKYMCSVCFPVFLFATMFGVCFPVSLYEIHVQCVLCVFFCIKSMFSVCFPVFLY